MYNGTVTHTDPNLLETFEHEDGSTTYVLSFICKTCGAESPQGIGYVSYAGAAATTPAVDCVGPHADGGVSA